MRFKCYILIIVSFLLISTTISAGQIDWVVVGDLNNRPDETGFGKVSYEYLISIYEVTNRQYCEFLNAVAKDDVYGLYDPEMSSSKFGGIKRAGERGDYSYTVKKGGENYPVNFVSWHDSLRFVNWLQNGMPKGGQGISTTEDGAYTFDGPERVGTRNKAAVFFLPSEDEWYKAAYYKGGGLDAGYWRYATQNDNQPAAEKAPGGSNSANAGSMPAGTKRSLTPAGAYKDSLSAYGTFDQAGNVYEWTETRFGNSQWCLRGGAFDTSSQTMKASVRDRNDPSHPASHNFGFRVAALPED